GSRRGIVQFDRVFQRQIGVAEDFIDHYVVKRQEIGRARGVGAGESGDVRRAVGEAAFGNALILRAKGNAVDQSARGGKDANRFTTGGQFEIGVVCAFGGIVIGVELQVAVRGRTDEGKRRDAILRLVVQIVRQVEPAQIYWLRQGTVDLKPILATVGI